VPRPGWETENLLDIRRPILRDGGKRDIAKAGRNQDSGGIGPQSRRAAKPRWAGKMALAVAP
jgi:hypothetical protein